MPSDAPRPLFLRVEKLFRPRTKYIPHQGRRERERRLRQLAKKDAR